MERGFRLFLIPLFFMGVVCAVSFVSADTIVLNSGVSQEVMVNVGGGVGGSFFGIVPTTPVVVVPPVTPESPGGGTTGGTTGTTVTVAVNPTTLSIDMQVDTVVRANISVTNLLETEQTVSVSQLELDDMIIFEESLVIPGSQTVTLEVTFAAPAEAGVYTGKIIIGGKVVSVALNVKTLLLLFDSNIVVLNDDYTVSQGEELKTLVTLIPMGDKARIDVTLDFVIKDYAGKTYLTKSDTLLIEDYTEVKRDFDTGTLPPGNYVIALNLVYAGGVAPSSAHFVVIERSVSGILGKIILFIIIIMLLIVVGLIIFFIIKRIKDKDENQPGASAPAAESPAPAQESQGDFFPQFPGTMG
ncbi:MAG: hypothetical protein KKB79_03190 [Nanoarchaeota archaeon]|nr:hypothetical protein [Nanoarchaeota archaeon]